MGVPRAIMKALRRPEGRYARLAFDCGQIALGLVIGALLFDRVVMPRVVRQGWDTEVPDMRGSTREEGQSLLHGARLKPGQILEVTDPDTPVGRIISQDPPAGARVRRGRLIHLLVSKGVAVHPVPDLAGKTVRSARLDLMQEGLQQGTILTLPSDAVLEGDVIGSHPQKGASPHEDGTVDLLVSGGAQKGLYLMPDLRGLDVQDAARRLRGAGIHVVSRDEPGGFIVIFQDPAPGGPVASGESVTFE